MIGYTILEKTSEFFFKMRITVLFQAGTDHCFPSVFASYEYSASAFETVPFWLFVTACKIDVNRDMAIFEDNDTLLCPGSRLKCLVSSCQLMRLVC